MGADTAGWADIYCGLASLRKYLLQRRQCASCRVLVDLAQPFHQPCLVHGADLIEDDLALLALEGKWNAGGVIATLGGHGRHDHGADMSVHLVRRDDHARAGLADFVTMSRVEGDEENIEAGDYQRHSVSSYSVA